MSPTGERAGETPFGETATTEARAPGPSSLPRSIFAASAATATRASKTTAVTTVPLTNRNRTDLARWGAPYERAELRRHRHRRGPSWRGVRRQDGARWPESGPRGVGAGGRRVRVLGMHALEGSVTAGRAAGRGQARSWRCSGRDWGTGRARHAFPPRRGDPPSR